MRYWFLLAILVLGCTASAPDSTARMVVSTDLGEEILLDTEVSSFGNSIGFLTMVADVKTTYSGKFVDSINGIETKPDSAWFYYVNGKIMDRGAASYIPNDGDIIQWDYHEYSGNPFEPATLNPPNPTEK